MRDILIIKEQFYDISTFCLSCVFGLLATYVSAQQTTHEPNIILIMVDDMGYSDIGAYGGEIHTPNLDQLAKEGVQFTQFYNTAKCTQSRASLLTGLYHQQTDNLNRTDNNVTLAEVFHYAGYETILSGKWHLGDWKNEKNTPLDRGFDHYFGFLGGAINFFTGEDWGTGKNYMRMDRDTFPVPDNFYSTDYFTDYAIDQVTEASGKNQPFFLYLAYNAPHFPLQVPQENIEKYSQVYSKGWDHFRHTRYDKMKKLGLIKPDWTLSKRDSIVPPWESLGEEERQEEQLLMATYAGMIDRLDTQIGRLLTQLKKLNIADNTIILFLSDNGGCPFDANRTPDLLPGPAESERTYDTEWANVSNTPFRKYKQWIHEGGISTPMIIRWPDKLKSDRMIQIPGQIIDIMPTLIDLAGLKYPDDIAGRKVLPMEGKSLVSYLENEGPASRANLLFWEYNGSRAVRDGMWKLVAERGMEWEFYNLEQDRTETNNLITHYPERVKKLAAEYDQWAERVGARSNEESINMPVNRQDRYLYEEEKRPR